MLSVLNRVAVVIGSRARDADGAAAGTDANESPGRRCNGRADKVDVLDNIVGRTASSCARRQMTADEVPGVGVGDRRGHGADVRVRTIDHHPIRAVQCEQAAALELLTESRTLAARRFDGDRVGRARAGLALIVTGSVSWRRESGPRLHKLHRSVSMVTGLFMAPLSKPLRPPISA